MLKCDGCERRRERAGPPAVARNPNPNPNPNPDPDPNPNPRTRAAAKATAAVGSAARARVAVERENAAAARTGEAAAKGTVGAARATAGVGSAARATAAVSEGGSPGQPSTPRRAPRCAVRGQIPGLECRSLPASLPPIQKTASWGSCVLG